MARKRNPNRDKAFEIYKSFKGEIKLSKIAEELNENPSNIRDWKRLDKWDSKIPRIGAPKGNLNAKGNKGNKNSKGAPKGNTNAIKHGFYMDDDKYIEKMKDILPKSLINTMSKLKDESHIDKLYRNILMLDAKIANAYRIIEVKDNQDHTKEIKKQDDDFIEYEVLFAIEKESKAGTAIAKMKDTLCKMLKTYNDLLDDEEKKVRIKKIKQDTAYLKAKTEQIKGKKKDTSLLESLINVLEED